MYAYMLLVSMILLEEVVVLFMVDGGVPPQATMISINADNHNRGGSSCQEAERRLTAMACSQAAVNNGRVIVVPVGPLVSWSVCKIVSAFLVACEGVQIA